MVLTLERILHPYIRVQINEFMQRVSSEEIQHEGWLERSACFLGVVPEKHIHGLWDSQFFQRDYSEGIVVVGIRL